MLTVTEIFKSVAGETSYAGLPTTFIRLTGCHLRCRYCDTGYAFEGGRETSIEKLLVEASTFTTPVVCVTGGEPLLQEDCVGLVSALCDRGFVVLVETSGSLDITPIDERAVTILDVKTPGSGHAKDNLLENLARLRPRDEVKVVVSSREDYLYGRDLLLSRGLVRRQNGTPASPTRVVYFNPAYGLLDPALLADWIIEDRITARIGLQIHKQIWGANAKGR